jgi:hypothetical protein
MVEGLPLETVPNELIFDESFDYLTEDKLVWKKKCCSKGVGMIMCETMVVWI